jgi:Family of unknown function (DUF5670)
MLPGAENRPVIMAEGAKAAGAVQVGTANPKRRSMPETLAVILVVLWLLGLVSSYMMGGYIHALLVIAVVVVMVRVIREEALEPSDFL